HDVCRLDIAVNQARVLEVEACPEKGVAQIENEGERRLGRRLELLFVALAVDKGFDEEDAVVVADLPRAVLENLGHEVGVEAGDGLDFPEGAAQVLAVRLDDLQRDAL